MSNVIFALPRTEYGSYQDLYTLIDLSDFDTCYIDEIDRDSDSTYIITVRNGELGAGWEGARASIYLFDLEWRRAPEAPIPGVKEVWMCDKWQAELTGSKYVPVGGHAGLASVHDARGAEQYDVAFLAYMTYRRQHVYNDLQARGVRMPPTSAWGAERDAILRASRVYLHIHQHDDIPAVPGLRLVIAAAYKLPFVSEACSDAGVFSDYIIPWSYGEIADSLTGWIGREARFGAFQASGERLHHYLCRELTFKASIEAAL